MFFILFRQRAGFLPRVNCPENAELQVGREIFTLVA